MKGYYLDPETSVVEEHFAIVYAPRRNRDRFPESCVEIVDTAEMARKQSVSAEKRYAAVVLGPARSSEGLRLFYLVNWLGEAE